MAHKAKHAIDLVTGAIVGVTVQGADEGDTATIQETLPEAAEQLEAVAAVTDDAVTMIKEVVADKGYHSRRTVYDLEMLAIRTYISEPERGPQSWIDQEGERNAVYANRRRIRGDREKRLPPQTRRIARATVCASLRNGWTPASARARARESAQTTAHAGAFNLGLGMRTLFGVGTPRSLQGRVAALGAMLSALWALIDEAMTAIWSQRRNHKRSDRPSFRLDVADSVV